MKASELFVKCLENEGVEYMFGVPGEENLDVMEALADSEQINFVTTRHEQGAAFMANVYGRLSTYPGVCLGTLGPGATNLITGVADAFLDRAPLVAITGQAARHCGFKESHQYIDIVRMLAPITKWNARIEQPGSDAGNRAQSLSSGSYGKAGATHIELPEDVAAEWVDAAPMPVRRTLYPQAPLSSLERVADLLQAAERPVVLVGNGVIRARPPAAGQRSGSPRLPASSAYRWCRRSWVKAPSAIAIPWHNRPSGLRTQGHQPQCPGASRSGAGDWLRSGRVVPQHLEWQTR